MSAGFPESPRGDPGGIAAAAAQLDQAAAALGNGNGLLASATGAMDWSGFAQSAYMGAAKGLGSVATVAADTCSACARIVARYGEELEQTRRELDRMRARHDELLAEAASARQNAQALSNLRAHSTDPVTASSYDSDINRYTARAIAATDEAEALRRRAVTLRETFDETSRQTSAQLEGRESGSPGALGAAADPFGPSPVGLPAVASGMSPGFGVPFGGLGHLRGVLSVSDPKTEELPGYHVFEASQAQNEPGGTDPGWLDPLVIAGGVGGVGAKATTKVAGRAGRAALGTIVTAGASTRAAVPSGAQLAERLGDRLLRGLAFKGEDQVASRAGREASESFLARHRDRPLGDRLEGAYDVRRNAEAQAIRDQREIAADNAKRLLEGAGHMGLPTTGLDDLLPHVVQFRELFSGFVTAQFGNMAQSGYPGVRTVGNAGLEIMERLDL